MVRIVLADEGTSELRPEGEGGASEANSQRKGVQAEGTVHAKAQRRKGWMDERNNEEARVLGAE